MKFQRFANIAATIAVCLLPGLTAGCSLWDQIGDYISSDKAEKCPDIEILAGAAALPAFAPGKDGDPSSVVYTATISNTKLSCTYREKQNKAQSDITLTIHATRPAGGAKAVYRIPYFIALTTNGRVLEKKEFWQDIAFDTGAATTDVEVTLDEMLLKPKRGRPAVYYHYVAGFQLTQAQIAYNKKMGPFEP